MVQLFTDLKYFVEQLTILVDKIFVLVDLIIGKINDYTAEDAE